MIGIAPGNIIHVYFVYKKHITCHLHNFGHTDKGMGKSITHRIERFVRIF